jgi:hypothetical protein
VIDIDQAQAMLDQARSKFPAKIGPSCCATSSALRPEGLLSFTVELADADETQAAFEQGQQMGLPVVHGEWGHEGCTCRLTTIRSRLRCNASYDQRVDHPAQPAIKKVAANDNRT